jgi:ribosomal protein L11 methyltransferase
MTRAPLVRLGIRVRRERADIALAALLPIFRHGAEESEPGEDEVEYAVYAPRGELPETDEIRALVGDALVDVTLTDVPPGWERRWHEHLRPVEVASGARRLRIRPPWLPAGGEQDVLEVVIDPGEQFGAGTHSTTQLCLELLLELDAEGGLCDWGAGTGVLAVVAARLGFSPVDAVELLPGALATVERNAAANGVAIGLHSGDLAVAPPPWAPTVTANLTLDILQAIAVDGLERPPERMIASGMLAARAGEVAEAFARHGLAEAERRVQGDWAAVLLTQPTSSAGTRERR